MNRTQPCIAIVLSILSLAALVALASCESGSVGSAREDSSASAPMVGGRPARPAIDRGLAAGTDGATFIDGQELWIIAQPDAAEQRARSTEGIMNYPEDWPTLSLRREVLLGDTPLLESLFTSADSQQAPRFALPFDADGDGRAESLRQIEPDNAWTIADPCGGIVGCIRTTGADPNAPPTFIPVPLEHTDVRASISAYIASVDVTQQFHNPYDGKIEAVYVFPLPQDAAVSEFIMTIGERTIRGIIREREEAERIYEHARSQGHVASLLTQQRPNIFTQKVANIEPGKRIDVSIRYFHTLAHDDGWYEFHFPMVVGPRFNPPAPGSGSGSDPVNALPRGARSGGPGTDVTYLAPNERSGHDIAIACEIDAGVAIEEVKCASHVVETRGLDSARTLVTLSPRDSIPNRDFVLRYRVAGERVKAAMLAQHDPTRHGGAGHFTLVIHPPAELASIQRQPVEMVFVLDCSGSMSGRPLDIAKAAAERVLMQLRPDDTFQIVRFSDSASALGAVPLPATDESVRIGVDHLRSLHSEGGTMMLEGIKAALDFPRDTMMERQRYVVFLTDGYIGNEAEVLGAMRARLNGARVFSVGIGSSVNRFLLEQMAALGEGVSAYVGLNDGIVEVMDRFVARVSHPALEDIAIDFGHLAAADVFPSRVPDLFVGRPIVLAGRFDARRAMERGEGIAQVRITGRVGSREVVIPIEVNVSDASNRHAAIGQVWARTRITQLMNRMMVMQAGGDADNDDAPATLSDLRGEALAMALEYGLMSAYTAFVAVDSAERTAGAHGTTVAVPVPVPDGVRYDTTVDQ
jgi:Ca-activated chloride channel family protein